MYAQLDACHRCERRRQKQTRVTQCQRGTRASHWMHFHKRVSELSHQTIRLTSRSEHQPGSEPPCRCSPPPLHLSKVSRGVDPPRQFTFCCSTRLTPLPHSILRDPNDPASGNGRNRANELFVAFPLWERPPTHCAHSTFRAPK
jgi:hypothetical protein